MDGENFSHRWKLWPQRWLAATLTLLLSLCPVAIAAASSQPRAYYALPGRSAGCDRGPLQFCYVARPTHFAFYGGAFSSLTWRNWGSPTTVASGRALVDLCSPECGEGDVVDGTATVELRGLRRHGDRMVYSCMVARGPKRTPMFRWGSDCSR